jgi:hypothetical protein
MNGDRQVIEALRDQRYDARTLDPERVMEGARRRRRRNRAATGLASAAVTGVAVTAFAVANGIGGPGAVPEPQVAGSGGPSSATSKAPGKSTPVKPRSDRVWQPGGSVGAKPIGTIPASGKVEISDQYWFETKGTRWCVSQKDGPYTNEPFGCRGTVGNANIGDGRLENLQGGNNAKGERVFSSVFRSDGQRRVLYTSGNTYYEAKLYRLAGVPGWMLAVVTLPSEQEETATMPPKGQSTQSPVPQAEYGVFGYDAGGKLVSRFPGVRDGGPKSDPLH